jgi:D-alanyl-D-alanine carboxypeptidase (penicillin-binding protein 5/6)
VDAAASEVAGAVPAVTLPAPPQIAARAYLLIDVTANQILAAQDMDAPVEPASLTKLMSAYLVFDALKSKKIDLLQTFEARMGGVKTPMSVDDLLKAMLVQSSNEAAQALAEAVGGTVGHFVDMLNQQAQVLGMKNTRYKNPDGLTEPGHITTARDLSILAIRLMNDFPQYARYFAIKQYRYPGAPASRNSSNSNLLLFRDPTVDGLKAGHSDAAGYCLVATAKREFAGVGSRRLLAIVLGAASHNARAAESQKLLNWGYTAYEAVKLFDADVPVSSPVVWQGNANALPLGQFHAIVVDVPVGTAAKLKTSISRPEPLVAPFAKGQPVGVLKVNLADQTYLELPLVALTGVEQSGLWGRAWDALRLWIK